MDGSTASLIVIPIVAMISLFTGVGLVYYAAAHPRWPGQLAAAPVAAPAPAAASATAEIPPPGVQVPAG